jgi:hypothetical protein
MNVANVLTVLVSGVVLIAMTAFYILAPDYEGVANLATSFGVPTDDCTQGGELLPMNDDPSLLALAGFVLLFATILGAGCMVIMVSIVHWFQTRANFQNGHTKFFSSAACAVYIIHPVVVVTFTRLFVVVIEALDGDVRVYFQENEYPEETQSFSSSCLGGDANLWVGAVVTITMIQLVVWPLGWAMRRLPGIRQVL